jgi:hypothetical protein
MSIRLPTCSGSSAGAIECGSQRSRLAVPACPFSLPAILFASGEEETRY